MGFFRSRANQSRVLGEVVQSELPTDRLRSRLTTRAHFLWARSLLDYQTSRWNMKVCVEDVHLARMSKEHFQAVIVEQKES